MPTTVYGGIIFPNIRSTTLTLRDRLSAQIFHLTRFRPLVGAEGLEPTETRSLFWRVCQFRHAPIFVKMDKLYLHFTQCFSLIYHQQHRIGCFLTLLSTTLLVVTLPPLTRFIFILICTWIGFSYVTPRTTFLPFLTTIQIHFTIVFPFY